MSSFFILRRQRTRHLAEHSGKVVGRREPQQLADLPYLVVPGGEKQLGILHSQLPVELAEMLQDLRGPDDYESQKTVLIDQLQEPDSTLSDMLRDVLEYLEKEKENLKKTHVISLMDVCEFERSRKGKTYKAGSITI